MTEHEAGHSHEVEVKLSSEPSRDYRVAAAVALAQAFEAQNRKITGLEDEIEEHKADREMRAREFDKLHKEAQNSKTDWLTDLPNRRAYDVDSEKWAQQTERGHFKLGLMIVDIDGQKRINDDKKRGGMERGDDLIKTVGKILESSIRGTDRAYRYGGDEFAILFQLQAPDLEGGFLTKTEQRFTDRLDEALVTEQFPEDLYLGASAGFGVMDDSENLSQFFNRVEDDMKRNKQIRRHKLVDQGIEFQDEDSRLLANN